jgi:hypothetical protein
MTNNKHAAPTASWPIAAGHFMGSLRHRIPEMQQKTRVKHSGYTGYHGHKMIINLVSWNLLHKQKLMSRSVPFFFSMVDLPEDSIL